MNEKRGEGAKRPAEAKGAKGTPPSSLPGGPSSAEGAGTGPGSRPSFEESLSRLEAIVQELEGGDLTLEETLTRYEEGARLASECARRLEEAEQRIRLLSSSMEGSDRNGGEGEGDDDEETQDGLPF